MSKRSGDRRPAQVRALKCAAALVATCVVLPVMAHAHTKGGPVIVGPDPTLPTMPIGDVLESRTGLAVRFEGVVPARCELGRGAEVDFGQLSGNQRVEAALGFYCNVPFDLNVRAARGGLIHLVQPGGEGPFAGRLGYDFDIDVPVLAPAERMLTGRYESRQLLAGVTLSSVDAIAKGGATIRIATRAPDGAGLLAGDYRESIMLTVSPRM